MIKVKKKMKNAAIAIGALGAMLSVSESVSAGTDSVENMGVVVCGQQTRDYSYSDKEAGFYYGMTGVDAWTDWYAGWNIRAKRIFSDYRLTVDGVSLKRSEAQSEVFPHKLVRNYSNAVESFYLVDGKKILYVAMQDVLGSRMGIELLGTNVKDGRLVKNAVVYSAVEAPGDVVCVVPAKASAKLAFTDGMVETSANAGGFLIVYGESEKEALSLADDFRKNGEEWLAQREARMNTLLAKNHIASDSPQLDNGLKWIELTGDELITRQHGGWGIYAGFPWFTDFWGRDMFISMQGLVLCTGQFEEARDIIASFAKYQDTDANSETYGRVPNRLNLEGILYNTTDGTPRFVIQIYDYLKYTGNTEFVKQIYKNVKIATDASLKLYTDEKGYLTHADADTWMDAKRQGSRPCSPRGNRAVDIQALWYDQLVMAAELADYMGEKEDACNWRAVAEKLKGNFERDFVDKETGRIYDHLNADGSGDLQLRPNTIYAHELLSDMSLKMSDARTVWEHLVYPWGVSSLDQMDDQFHPYHEQWHRYHKDDAYHNGTIWLWNNGQAMQRLIEYGQQDIAYRLFKNMNRQALEEGAVGGLSENADAWPRPGQTWVRRSGTFLQAWSNAEHIRVWDQYFLGIRPNMLKKEITVNPKLPSDLNRLQQSVCIGDGNLNCNFSKLADGKQYVYTWTGSGDVKFLLDFENFSNLNVNVPSGGKVVVALNETEMHVMVFDADANKTANQKVAVDKAKVVFQTKCDKFFEGTDFAKPCYREDLKSMSRYFNPPLDYYSAE